MSKVLFYAKYALGQLSELSNPVADAAVVGLVIKLDPSIHIDTATFVGILAGVGIVSRWVLAQITSVAKSAKAAYSAKVAAKKAAK